MLSQNRCRLHNTFEQIVLLAMQELGADIHDSCLSLAALLGSDTVNRSHTLDNRDLTVLGSR